jgi:uncharacterized delta-60 repeat protein
VAEASDFGLVCYNSNGSLDTNFGSDGKVITDFGACDLVRDVAVGPDGEIVVAGNTTGSDTNRDFALARYNSNGSLVSEFGSDGKVITDLNGDDDDAFAVGFQQSGKIIAAGSSFNAILYLALARYEGEETNFDICLEDDSNGNRLQFNSTTGDYLFTNCTGTLIGGTGTVTKKGKVIKLKDSRSDRRVQAQLDNSIKRGTASIQLLSTGSTFIITDRNLANNTCSCQ